MASSSHVIEVNPTARNPAFYGDLRKAILDFLCSDKASLRACSLVCRDWLDDSQRCLFHQVVISTRARYLDCVNGLPTISPRIRSMPRVLQIHPEGDLILTRAEVICILDCLTGIHTLDLEFLVLDPSIDSNAWYPPRPLKSLRLHHIYGTRTFEKPPAIADIISFICLFRSIQRLEVTVPFQIGCGLLRQATTHAHCAAIPSPHLSLTTLPLRHLHLDEPSLDTSMLRYLRMARAADHLRTIKLWFYDCPFAEACSLGALQELLGDNPSVLESLSIDLPHSPYHHDRRLLTTWKINPSLFTNLRAVSLVSWIYDDPLCGEFLLNTVEHFASTSSMSTLCLTLKFGLYGESDLPKSIAVLYAFDWERLSRSLVRYRQLKDVRLEMCSYEQDRDQALSQTCLDTILGRVLSGSGLEDETLRVICSWRYGYDNDESLRAFERACIQYLTQLPTMHLVQ